MNIFNIFIILMSNSHVNASSLAPNDWRVQLIGTDRTLQVNELQKS